MAWLSIDEPTQTFYLNGNPYTVSGVTDQTNRMDIGQGQTISFQQQMQQRGACDIGLRVYAGDTYAPTVGTEIFMYDQTASAWAASFGFNVNQRIVDGSGHTQVVIVAGITGSTEPTWDDSGGTTTDGSVTWEDMGVGTGIQFLCVFVGTIDKIELTWDGVAGDRLYHLTVVSLEQCFDVIRIPPIIGFVAQYAGAIVASLYNTLMAGAPVALPSGTAPYYGLSPGNIVPSISWTNWPRLSEVINDLATGCNFIWGVNPQTQQLYFCPPPNATGAPFVLSTSQIQWESMKWTQNRQDYRNRQILQIQAAAFAQSSELFTFPGGSDIPYFNLMRPPAQVTFAWLTQNTQAYQFGTFHSNMQNGDTITISYPTAGSIYQFQALTDYAVGQAVIDPAGYTQIVTSAGESGATAPTWADFVGGTTSSGSVVFTNQGIQLGGQYTFVTALDNTQWGQVLIGSSAGATEQNFIDAINSNQAQAGSTFSWPTWENPLVNGYIWAGLEIQVRNKPAGAGYSAGLSTSSGGRFTWTGSATTGGADHGTTYPLAVAQNGQSSTANLYYTPGQLQVALASVPTGFGNYPPQGGWFLQVQYTRLGGDCIVCENTAAVIARAGIENGTGKYQQFSSDTDQASNAGGLAECQAELTAYLPLPVTFEFDTLVCGLLAGQVLTIDVEDSPPGIAALVNGQYAVQEIRGELVSPGAGEGFYLNVPDAGHFRYTVSVIDVAQIGSWLDFWQDLIGGGSESSGLGAALGGGQATGASGQIWTCRCILPGVQAVATNVLANRYRVTLPAASFVTLNECTITAQVKASSSSFIADVLLSTDFGVTWNSLFPSGSANKAVLPVNTEQVILTPTWAITKVFDGNQIRVDVIQADGVASGLEVLIEGAIGQNT